MHLVCKCKASKAMTKQSAVLSAYPSMQISSPRPCAILQLAYLERMPFTLRLEGRGVLVVHAGLRPGRSLPRQYLYDLYTLRECRACGVLSCGIYLIQETRLCPPPLSHLHMRDASESKAAKCGMHHQC